MYKHSRELIIIITAERSLVSGRKIPPTW